MSAMGRKRTLQRNAVPSRAFFSRLANIQNGEIVLAEVEQQPKLEWPRWASIALAAIVVTSVVTIIATINDIW
jgi:hypothetical protein